MKPNYTNSDSYLLQIEKPGVIFTGTRKELENTVREMYQLGLLPLTAPSMEEAVV